MQSNTNNQSLISQLPTLSDEKIKRDYLNHLEWTESIGAILPLIDDSEALRVVRLALNVDLMLGAFLAGKVKSELQSETVGWIYELEISDELKLKLLTKTKSKVAVYFLEYFIKNIPNPTDSLYIYENLISQTIKDLEIVDAGLYTRILLNLLEDERQWVRRMGIAIFGEHIDKSEISILNRIIYFLDDEDRTVRSQTVKALKLIGGDLAEELIIHAFLDKEDSVSKNVFETLLKIDRNRAITLILLASQCDDAGIRRKAALFLGKIVKKSDRASDLPLFVNLLNDVNSIVRKTASKELTVPKTGMESPEFEALREEYQELSWEAEIDIEEIINESDLTTLLQDKDVRVRQEAVFAVGHIISPVDTAEETVNKFSENQRRNLAIALVKILDDKDEELRRRIAVVLKRIVGESISEDLIQAFEDGKRNLQADIARLLKLIGNKNSAELLFSILQDKNSSAREILISGLNRFGLESNIQLLIQMVAGEKNPSARENMIRELEETRNPIPISTIIEILKNEKNPSARVLMVRTLESIGGELAENAIINVLLKDEDYIVCDKAACALGVVGEKSVVALRQAMLNPSGGCNSDSVLETIVEALGKIGSDSAIEAIFEPLSTDTCLDSFASITLGRFGSLKNVPQLWNIQIKARDKTSFCDAIEQIQQRHRRYNPGF